MLPKIIALIESYQTITIYPHQHADGDALGSSFGLKIFLLDQYPTKDVRVLGTHTKDNGVFFPLFDDASVEYIASSLAIVVDTANHERVDDQRYQKAANIIKIDHHPGDDSYGDINFVVNTASSTSELIVKLARECNGNQGLSLEAATYLYAGLMSDTMSFSTASTNADSLESASYLARCGVKLDEVAYHFRAKSLPVYHFITELRNQLHIENDVFAYAIVPRELYTTCGLSFEDAKGNVSEFSRISGLLVWCVFIEGVDGNYQGSLRSRQVGINDIAASFGGGGHQFAAGVKVKNMSEVQSVIAALRKRIKEVCDETEFSI